MFVPITYFNFSDWLWDRYREWEKRGGKKQKTSLQEYANYLNVSQPAITQWLDEGRKPNDRSIKKLADKYGPEAYVILGYLPPDQELQEAIIEIIKVYHSIPNREEKLKFIMQFLSMMGAIVEEQE